MAHWGVAMTLFQPLWPTRPRPEALQRGWEEVQKAKALQAPTERERLFVAATEAFFREPASLDYWLRIRRWEEAMEKAYASFPNLEVAAFYALAHLATTPSGTISRAHSDRAAEILLRVYERNPDHPGAMHYLVHANDVPGRERESLEITRKYEPVAPRNPPALHMPTHIYTRLGDWNGVIRGNLRSAEAALEYPAGDHGEFVWDHFPHAIEYLVYAYLQKGADDSAAAQLKRLRATGRLEPTFITAFHLTSTQARYALERRAWNEAVLLVPREPATLDWDRFTWPEAVARFARGLGAWLAHVERQKESSVALMREAGELEATTPKHAVTPGPTLPAHELLGDLLMEQKQPAEALVAYKRSLEFYPRRFNGLLGAARVARALGYEAGARTFYQELLAVADGGMRQPALKEAQTYVAQRR